jgi:predicted acyl esterase
MIATEHVSIPSPSIPPSTRIIQLVNLQISASPTGTPVRLRMGIPEQSQCSPYIKSVSEHLHDIEIAHRRYSPIPILNMPLPFPKPNALHEVKELPTLIFEKNVDIPLKDGQGLCRGNVYRPKEEGKYPVILTCKSRRARLDLELTFSH